MTALEEKERNRNEAQQQQQQTGDKDFDRMEFAPKAPDGTELKVVQCTSTDEGGTYEAQVEQATRRYFLGKLQHVEEELPPLPSLDQVREIAYKVNMWAQERYRNNYARNKENKKSTKWIQVSSLSIFTPVHLLHS